MSDYAESTITTEDKVQTAEEIAAELEAEEAAKSGGETQERPEWLPEKFKSPEDMAAAYSELERKLSSGEKLTDEEKSLAISKDSAESAVEKAGLDFDALAQKYAEKGALEDSDYEALEKSGLARSVVDNYIKGQQALAAQFESKIYEQFGDKDAYQEMVQWASSNLSEAQIDLFNQAVESGDIEKALFAINGLKAQYTAANGSEPSRSLNGKPATGGPRYQSEAEMIRDMQDPRYWSDQAFREEVDRKFNSTWGAA